MRDAVNSRKRKMLGAPRYGIVCVPGRAKDGSDSAWFVAPVGRHWRPGATIYVGDGDAAMVRARKRAVRLNTRKRRRPL